MTRKCRCLEADNRMQHGRRSVVVTAKYPSVTNPSGPILSAVEDGILRTTVFPIQVITRLAVTPRADRASFVFRAAVAAVPVLDIRFGDAISDPRNRGKLA